MVIALRPGSFRLRLGRVRKQPRGGRVIGRWVSTTSPDSFRWTIPSESRCRRANSGEYGGLAGGSRRHRRHAASTAPAATGAATSRCARRSNPTSSTAPSCRRARVRSFRIDAWSDPYTTWRSAVIKKVDAGRCGRSGQRSGDRCRGADPRTRSGTGGFTGDADRGHQRAGWSPRRRIENRVGPGISTGDGRVADAVPGGN